MKRDFYVSNDNKKDDSWDVVWNVGTKIESVRWVAEFRIPFSRIRFAPGSEKTFGLPIVRDAARTGERMSWPLIKRSVQGYVIPGWRIVGDRRAADAAAARGPAVHRRAAPTSVTVRTAAASTSAGGCSTGIMSSVPSPR